MQPWSCFTAETTKLNVAKVFACFFWVTNNFKFAQGLPILAYIHIRKQNFQRSSRTGGLKEWNKHVFVNLLHKKLHSSSFLNFFLQKENREMANT